LQAARQRIIESAINFGKYMEAPPLVNLALNSLPHAANMSTQSSEAASRGSAVRKRNRKDEGANSVIIVNQTG
jgi:hypothetical protein